MFQKILVGVDFCEASVAALHYATQLMHTMREAGGNPSLEVIHCYEIPAVTGPDGSVLVGPEAATDIADNALQQLRGLLEKECPSDVEPHERVVVGPPAESILARAKEVGADLIVVGSHGRSGLQRFFLGSVAEQVLRAAAIPVLSVRPQG